MAACIVYCLKVVQTQQILADMKYPQGPTLAEIDNNLAEAFINETQNTQNWELLKWISIGSLIN